MANQPDYDYLLKLENWSKKDASLIICGLNPPDYRSVRFSYKGVPGELEEAHKIYRIFCSVDFRNKYGFYEPHPVHFIQECNEKDIPLPDGLIEAIKRRIAHNKKRKEILLQEESAEPITQNDEVPMDHLAQGARERKYLLKIIGAIAVVCFEEKNKSSSLPYPKIVVSDIVEDILQYQENNDLRSPGLGKSNLHKKITEGLAVFEEEYC